MCEGFSLQFIDTVAGNFNYYRSTLPGLTGDVKAAVVSVVEEQPFADVADSDSGDILFTRALAGFHDFMKPFFFNAKACIFNFDLKAPVDLLPGDDHLASLHFRLQPVDDRIFHNRLQGHEGYFHFVEIFADIKFTVDMVTEADLLDKEIALDAFYFIGEADHLIDAGEVIAQQLGERGDNGDRFLGSFEKGHIDHCIKGVDQEMGVFIHHELEKQGVEVLTDDEILRFEQHKAFLKSGSSFKTDLVISAVGVIPDTKIAKDAGIQTGQREGIIIDQHFKTSCDHIYAVGDAVIVKQQITLEDALIPLASPANRQGRQLADILSGLNVTHKGTLGTSIVKVFDLSLAATGLNEKQLVGKNYKVIHLTANDHASYYPGATPIYLKVIFNPSTQMILGAQAVGEKGVDKRIDIIATAIKGGIKVTDLQELELSYAPPYSSAKDIVNLTGYVASNVILGLTDMVQWYEVKKLIEKKEDVLFLDVRSPFERDAYGYIKSSINIDVDQIPYSYETLPKEKKIIIYCDLGTKSYHAERFLKSKGYNVCILNGAFSMISNMLKEHIYV